MTHVWLVTREWGVESEAWAVFTNEEAATDCVLSMEELEQDGDVLYELQPMRLYGSYDEYDTGEDEP